MYKEARIAILLKFAIDDYPINKLILFIDLQ
jgi:hypothetical protein